MELSLSEFTPLEQKISELNANLKGVIFEVETPAGFKAAKKARTELRTVRTAVEATRKKLKEPVLDAGRTIDRLAAEYTQEITALENPLAQQIESEEQRRKDEKRAAETKRQNELNKWRAVIEKTRLRPLDFMDSPPDEIRAGLEKAEAVDLVKIGMPDELMPEAKVAMNYAIEKMKEQLHIAERAVEDEARIKAEREELERLRAEKAAKPAAEPKPEPKPETTPAAKPKPEPIGSDPFGGDEPNHVDLDELPDDSAADPWGELLAAAKGVSGVWAEDAPAAGMTQQEVSGLFKTLRDAIQNVEAL